MAYPLSSLPWIDPPDRARLLALGLRTTRQLLRASATPAQRVGLEARTGISAERILVWTHRADLLRLTGLGPVYVQLLARAGLGRLADLAAWSDPRRLALRLQRVCARAAAAGTAPGVAVVHRWLSQARRVVPCVWEAGAGQPRGPGQFSPAIAARR